jgi:hypothetical protein
MQTKEQFIEQVMSSTDGMSRATANPLLTDKIMEQVQGNKRRTVPLIPRSAIWLAAASLLLLVGVNVAVCLQAQTVKSNTNTTNPVADEYFSYLNTNNNL